MADKPAADAGLRADQCDSPKCVVCALCGTFEGLSLCSGCKETWYCSKQHQRSHWRDHKSACKHVGKKQRKSRKTGSRIQKRTNGQELPDTNDAIRAADSGRGGEYAAAGSAGDEALSICQAGASEAADTADGTYAHAAGHVGTPVTIQQKCGPTTSSSVGVNTGRLLASGEGGDNLTSSLVSDGDVALYNTPDCPNASDTSKAGEGSQQLIAQSTGDRDSVEHHSTTSTDGNDGSMTANKPYCSLVTLQNNLPLDYNGFSETQHHWQSQKLGVCDLSGVSDQTAVTASALQKNTSAHNNTQNIPSRKRLSRGGNPAGHVDLPTSLASDHCDDTTSYSVNEDVKSTDLEKSFPEQTAHHRRKVRTKQLTKSSVREATRGELEVGPNVTEQGERITEEDNMRYADPRAQMSTIASEESKEKTSQPETKLVDYVVRSLKNYGLCVVDNFMGEEKSVQILQEVLDLYQTDTGSTFREGQLVSSSSGSTQRVRGDRITWVDGSEEGCSEIETLLARIDKLMLSCKGHFTNRNIGGRTKAMVACYPGQGTGYKRHVDNPNSDGRCITAIYYLNRNWNVKSHGGLLRIFPHQFNQVADIEPKLDRLLFFWSDRRNPHEVHPSFRTRFAITVWYFDRKEREEALKRPKMQ